MKLNLIFIIVILIYFIADAILINISDLNELDTLDKTTTTVLQISLRYFKKDHIYNSIIFL